MTITEIFILIMVLYIVWYFYDSSSDSDSDSDSDSSDSEIEENDEFNNTIEKVESTEIIEEEKVEEKVEEEESDSEEESNREAEIDQTTQEPKEIIPGPRGEQLVYEVKKIRFDKDDSAIKIYFKTKFTRSPQITTYVTTMGQYSEKYSFTTAPSDITITDANIRMSKRIENDLVDLTCLIIGYVTITDDISTHHNINKMINNNSMETKSITNQYITDIQDKTNSIKHIDFINNYKTIPTVLVSIIGMEKSLGKRNFVQLSAKNISLTGFDINAYRWGGNKGEIKKLQYDYLVIGETPENKIVTKNIISKSLTHTNIIQNQISPIIHTTEHNYGDNKVNKPIMFFGLESYNQTAENNTIKYLLSQGTTWSNTIDTKLYNSASKTVDEVNYKILFIGNNKNQPENKESYTNNYYSNTNKYNNYNPGDMDFN